MSRLSRHVSGVCYDEPTLWKNVAEQVKRGQNGYRLELMMITSGISIIRSHVIHLGNKIDARN